MTVELRWTAQARADMLEIYTLIATDSPAAAERVFTDIEAKVGMLSKYPRMGPRRPEIYPSMRILVEGPYLVLYETEPDTDDRAVKFVNIMRVVDGRRDLRRLV